VRARARVSDPGVHIERAVLEELGHAAHLVRVRVRVRARVRARVRVRVRTLTLTLTLT